MSLQTLIARGIKREADSVQSGMEQIQKLRNELAIRRDALQAELATVKEELAKYTTDLTESQKLLEGLQAEISTVQERVRK
jgi:septal ring factor EnvC (AmiA/AmiB activator)